MSALADHVWGVSPAVDRVWAQVAGRRPHLAGKRRFLVFQGFMDESDDSGAADTGWFVLAGYIASAEQWAAFTREWEDVALPLISPDREGRRVFKHKRMKRDPERLAVFHSIIMRHVEMSVACMVNKRDIAAALARVRLPEVDGIDWSAFSNPYYVTFRYFMDTFHRAQLEEHENVPVREPVDFYFDTSLHKKQIQDSWEAYMNQRNLDVREWFGGDPKFERDDEFMPLQAADFNAGTNRVWLNEYGLGPVLSGERKQPFAVRGDRAIHHLMLPITEDDMARDFVVLANEALHGTAFAADTQPRPTPPPVDPPSPFERASAQLAKLVAGLFGRGG